MYHYHEIDTPDSPTDSDESVERSKVSRRFHLLIQKSMTVDCRGTTTAPLVFHVKENVPGALIGQVLPNNGTTVAMSGTQFLIVNQQDVPDIAIMDDGSLYAPKGLDRETRQNYSITVIAESLRSVGVFQVNSSIRSSSCNARFFNNRCFNHPNGQVRIIVDDENDHAPQFTLTTYEGRIMENSPSGTEVTLANPIVASDQDEGKNQNFVFTLRGEGSHLFRIDPITGRVYFVGIDKRTLDRESRADYEFQVIATDSGRC